MSNAELEQMSRLVWRNRKPSPLQKKRNKIINRYAENIRQTYAVFKRREVARNHYSLLLRRLRGQRYYLVQTYGGADEPATIVELHKFVACPNQQTTAHDQQPSRQRMETVQSA